ncbi:hypothetical protein EVG20_g7957 [Dentipellis fragilis]|uniref:60S ribosomal export protein NMD3 n=1 Tax=Dentipellis fragilis TaxID=205917 RepID=A0A4Y9Y8W0_9AGAM|nr:hypothetical protein EVG20_g7957 [Dentipellis fragilis]
MEFVPAPAVHRVLCADCGIPITPNSANLCVGCLRNSVDITEGIPKQSAVSYCRNCERFLAPPGQWIIARPESQELLALCLKKLKGLSKVRLTEAHFIWTEPHSKRLRVSLTIQKEVLTNTILEQIFEIEYLVQHGQCQDCAKLAAKNTWKALVQVRQKVPHKRTFLFLEQLILKNGAQKDTIMVKEVKDGLDFFYSARGHALKMTEFLAAHVPVRSKASERLLSSDTHTSTANFKHTYSVEIVPICKDDLVCMPVKLARQLGNISPLTVCMRVGNSIHLLDPATLQFCEVTSPIYWRTPFDSLASVSDMVEFTVLDIEPSGTTRGKWVLADAQVALSGAFRSTGTHEDADVMDYDGAGSALANQIFHTRTHLGAILQPGDTAPAGAHPGHRAREEVVPEPPQEEQDAQLAPAQHRQGGGRGGRDGRARGVVGRMGGRDQKKVEEDYELFLRDLEEDPEMRSATRKRAHFSMDVDEAGAAHGMEVAETTAEVAEAEEPEEADFPEVRLGELLENFDEMTLGVEEPEEQL